MRISCKEYLILLCSIFLFISGYSQRDTSFHIQVKEASIPETLEQLSFLTKASISYNPEIFKEETHITLDTTGSFLFLLTTILDDRPYSINRTRRGSVVIRYDKSKERIRIYGRVVDAESGETLMSCNVYRPDRSVGTVTNEYGFFSIKVPADGKPLIFSYLGYEKFYLKLSEAREQKVKIKLKTSAELDEVLIFNQDSVDNSLTQQGIVELTLSDLRNQPAAGGEEDITTMIRVLPGVQSGADGIGGLFVRGGTDDQNLVTVDGSTLYFPSHVFGLYSIVNSSSLRRAVVSKDNHLVPSGKRLSSSIDLWSREGNSEHISGTVQVAPSSVRGVLEGPLSRSTSFIITGRRSLFTPTRILPDNIDGRMDADTEIAFYDYSAKLSTRINGQHQLIAHMLRGEDRYDYVNQFRTDSGLERDELRDFNWGNTLYSLRYNVSIGNQAYLKTGVHRTEFSYKADQVQYIERADSDQNRLLAAHTEIKDWRAHADVDVQHGNEQYTRLGISYTRHSIRQGLFYTSDPFKFNELDPLNNYIEQRTRLNDQDGNQFDVYLEEILAVGQKTKVQLGLFTSIYSTSETEYLNVLPKVSLRHQFSNTNAFFFYAQRTAQNIHKFDVDASGYPTSLWFLADENIRPKTNYLFSAQYHKRWSSRIKTELGTYYSRVNNLLFPASTTGINEESSAVTRLDPLQYMQVLNGTSRGIESKLIIENKSWLARFNYTFSDTDRENVQTGAEVRPIQDRRHTVDALFQYNFPSGITCAVVQSYGSTNPPQFSHASFDHVLSDGISSEIEEYSRTGDFELNSLYRTDINLQYQLDIGPTTHNLSVGVYNAFNRRQELYRWIDTITDDNAQSFTVDPVLSLGRQFQFRYSLHF